MSAKPNEVRELKDLRVKTMQKMQIVIKKIIIMHQAQYTRN